MWALLLLSSLAAVASYIARTNAVLTHRALQIAQAEAAADAAIVDTISKMSDALVARRPAVGSSREWEFEGVKVIVAVSSEAGRIDVNTADSDLMLAFLYSQGVDEKAAQVLLDELRVREPGKSPHMQGNASAAMQSHGTLKAIDELRRLPSWEERHVECWMDSLTVYTGLTGISAADATAKALGALKWAQAHHLGDHDWVADNIAIPGALSDRSTLGEVLRIVATASVSTDANATGEWVGRLTGDLRKPMLTMRWERLSASMVRPSCNDNVIPAS